VTFSLTRARDLTCSLLVCLPLAPPSPRHSHSPSLSNILVFSRPLSLDPDVTHTHKYKKNTNPPSLIHAHSRIHPFSPSVALSLFHSYALCVLPSHTQSFLFLSSSHYFAITPLLSFSSMHKFKNHLRSFCHTTQVQTSQKKHSPHTKSINTLTLCSIVRTLSHSGCTCGSVNSMEA